MLDLCLRLFLRLPEPEALSPLARFSSTACTPEFAAEGGRGWEATEAGEASLLTASQIRAVVGSPRRVVLIENGFQELQVECLMHALLFHGVALPIVAEASRQLILQAPHLALQILINPLLRVQYANSLLVGEAREMVVNSIPHPPKRRQSSPAALSVPSFILGSSSSSASAQDPQINVRGSSVQSGVAAQPGLSAWGPGRSLVSDYLQNKDDTTESPEPTEQEDRKCLSPSGICDHLFSCELPSMPQHMWDGAVQAAQDMYVEMEDEDALHDEREVYMEQLYAMLKGYSLDESFEKNPFADTDSEDEEVPSVVFYHA